MDATVSDSGVQKPLIFVPLLNSASKSVRALLGLEMAEIGLAVGQDLLLVCLSQREALTTQEVCKELDVRPSTISKMTDRLVAKGLAERMLHPDDKRVAVLRLTPAGREKCSDVLRVWRNVQESLLRGEPLMALPELQASLAHLGHVLRAKLARLR